MVEHTPTPWHFNEFIYGEGPIFTKIADPYCMSTNHFGDEMESNAKFIVTACNNHDALVKVLSELYEAISIEALMAAATQGPDFDIDTNLRDKRFAAACLLADLRKEHG